MVKSCCAVVVQTDTLREVIYRSTAFPVDPVRRSRWVAAIKRERWEPNEHSFLCSAHFVSGKKSQDPSLQTLSQVFSNIWTVLQRGRK